MRQFAIFGLGTFGRSVLENLRLFDQIQTVVFDHNEKSLSEVREFASQTVITDLRLRLDIIRHLPENPDVVIIDLGSDTHTTLRILYNIREAYPDCHIVVSTPDDDLAAVYQKVGASEVIVPGREAAIRVVPYLISDLLFSYIPVGKNFGMAEIQPPKEFHHKTLRELNLRQRYELNVVAVRRGGGEYELFQIDHTLLPGENLLVVGDISKLNAFLINKQKQHRISLDVFLKHFFGKRGS